MSKHVKEHEQVGEQAFDAQAVYSNKNDVRPAQQGTRGGVLTLAPKLTVHRRSYANRNREGDEYHQGPRRTLCTNHRLSPSAGI